MATATPRPMVLDGHEVREMTKAEHDQYKLDLAEWQAQAAASAAKEATRQAALDKLGLTADEVAALFG